jgi:hypothetical protein
MRRRLLFLLTALPMALALGTTSAVAASASGTAGFSVLNPGSALPARDLAPDSSGNVTCSGVAPSSVPGDLIVPSGVTCFAVSGTTIGNDIVVQQGGSLGTGGITVGHDVIGQNPAALEIGDFRFGSAPSFIGNDINVTGGTSDLYVQEVCNATVGGSLIWRNLAPTGGLGIGDGDFICAAPRTDHVGHDGIFLNNQGAIMDISDNNPANGGGFGDALIVQNNTNTVVESNAIGHACVQHNNHPYTNDDGDSTGPNTAGSSIGTCNTTNP